MSDFIDYIKYILFSLIIIAGLHYLYNYIENIQNNKKEINNHKYKEIIATVKEEEKKIEQELLDYALEEANK